MRIILAMLIAGLLALGSMSALAQTSPSSALINQQLDRLTKLQLSGTLPEAMGQIAKQTGVPVEADPAVWELLPWGKETAVTATIENQTLRQALEAITRKLGLTFVLKDEAVELQPMPALRRLGRKSTVSELEALYTLASAPLELKGDKVKLKEALEAIDLKLEALKSPYAVENRAATNPDKVPQDSLVSIPRNATLMDALEAISRQASATWYPWGKTIVVLPKSDQVRRMLSREVTLRHEGTDIAQVLTELSSKSGVPFTFEPGSIQALAPQSRNVRLVLSASVVDALEAVSGLTGLGYLVRDNDVYIWNASVNSQAAVPRDRTVAIINTEAGMQVMLTESQCPDDVRQYLEFQKKKHIDAVRKMMAEQGFTPTTRPANGGGPASKPATPAAPPAQPANGKSEPPGKDL